MARRGDHSREELKQMIIDTAYDILDKDGLAKLSVRNIINKIGYTVGTLYQIFSNLNELILHLNTITLDDLYNDLSSASLLDDPINQMAKIYINYSNNHFNKWDALFAFRPTNNEAMPQWYQSKINNIFDLIDKTLQQQININQKDSKIAAQILWSGLHGICTLSINKKLDIINSESAEILSKKFIDNFIIGLENNTN